MKKTSAAKTEPKAKSSKATAAEPSAEVDTLKVLAVVVAHRKGLDFDAKVFRRSVMMDDEFQAAAKHYGVAAHGPKPIASAVVSHCTCTMVDFKGLSPTLGSEAKGFSIPNDMVLQAFLDGYALACELAGGSGKAKKTLGTSAVVTKFIKGGAERWEAVADGELKAFFEPLIGDLVKQYGEGMRRPAAGAFAVGVLLRCHEFGVTHPLFTEVQTGEKKPRGPAIPKGTATENKDLLDAILAHPEDDAPRLVYADHLTAAGDARGEFIVLQCSLGNTIDGAGKFSTPPTKQVDDADAKVKRAQTLAKQFHGKWLSGVRLDSVTWERGFPKKGYCDAIQFAQEASYDRVPIEELSLIHWSGKVVDAVWGRNAHPSARKFWFGSGFGPKTLHALGAPAFARAKGLSAGFWDDAPIPPKTLDMLAKWKFADLEELSFPLQLIAAFDKVECPKVRQIEISDWIGSINEVRTTGLWKRMKHLLVYWQNDGTRLAGAGEPEFAALRDAKALEILAGVNLKDASAQALLDAAPASLKTIEGSFGDLGAAMRKALEARFTLKQ